MFKRLSFIFMVVLVLSGCGVGYDYTTEEARVALDNGEDLVGAYVLVDVDILDDNFFFGPTIRTNNYISFITDVRPEVEVGDQIVVEVLGYEYIMGAWLVDYKY